MRGWGGEALGQGRHHDKWQDSAWKLERLIWLNATTRNSSQDFTPESAAVSRAVGAE